MNETGSRPHLVILGMMGVGKSTTARAVAHSRSLSCFDSDIDIETTLAMTGEQLAAAHGIDELHRVESAMLLGRLASTTPAVISAAAWVVEDERCRQALSHRATVVVLHADVDEIMRRAATGDHRRPMERAELTALVERRAPLFAAVSDLDVDAMLSTQELVDLVNAKLPQIA